MISTTQLVTVFYKAWHYELEILQIFTLWFNIALFITSNARTNLHKWFAVKHTVKWGRSRLVSKRLKLKALAYLSDLCSTVPDINKFSSLLLCPNNSLHFWAHLPWTGPCVNNMKCSSSIRPTPLIAVSSISSSGFGVRSFVWYNLAVWCLLTEC